MTPAAGDGTAAGAAAGPALSALGVHKTFGGTAALRGVDLRVRRGTIHALLGGNGSGKSTLIKCLAGVHRADAGEVIVGDRVIPAAHMTPRAARAAGLRFVHQDLALFDELSVAENIAMATGFPVGAGARIRWADLHRRVRRLLADYGIAARPRDSVASLRPSQKTMVAVARALADQEDSEHVLLLDEPTATLPERESQELMGALRARAQRGQTIILVSHRLGEIEQVADAATVFRDGTVLTRRHGAGLSAVEMTGILTGTEGPGAGAGVSVAKERADRSRSAAPPVLLARGLTAGPVHDLGLTVHAGEIVGLAGLAGAGKSTVLRALFGLRALDAGAIRLDGGEYRPRGPRHAAAAGVAYVPEDRHGEGIFPDLSVRENATATVLSQYWKRFRFDWRGERRDTAALITRHGIRTASMETPVGRLSGGNQQKLVLGTWMRRAPRLLLLDEPTQGVDVRSRAEIYDSLREHAATGCGVLVASADLDELHLLCDRVLVLSAGSLVQEIRPASTSRAGLVAAVLRNDTPMESSPTES